MTTPAKSEPLSETIRRWRTLRPVAPETVAEVQAWMDAQATRDGLDTSEVNKNIEALALAMRAHGRPVRVITPEDAAREDRAMVAMAYDGLPSALVLARLALAFGSQYVVHSLHPSAARTVADTDLAFWPTEAPVLLRHPLVVEADVAKGRTLYGDVQALALLPGEPTWLLVQTRGGGVAVATLDLTWSKEDDAETTGTILDAALADSVRVGADGGAMVNRAAALRYVVTLGLFLSAESQASGKSVTEATGRAGTLPDGRPPKQGQGFTVRHIRISDEAHAKPAPRPADRAQTEAPHGDRLHEETVAVRGFLRRQRCGPGGKDRKVIFVAPFTRRQWVAEERRVRVL